MDRVNLIIHNKEYSKRIREIEESEADRVFCRHGYDHLLMVARLGYALLLEDMHSGKKTMADDFGLEYSKELIYATALLHDIGRFSKYEKEQGMNHRESGIYIATPILKTAGYSGEEISLICNAIRAHGSMSDIPGSLEGIIYRADKRSRSCFSCMAYDICNWPEERKNVNISI